MQSAEPPLTSSGSTESSESRRLQSTSTRPRTPSLSRSVILDPADRHLHHSISTVNWNSTKQMIVLWCLSSRFWDLVCNWRFILHISRPIVNLGKTSSPWLPVSRRNICLICCLIRPIRPEGHMWPLFLEFAISFRKLDNAGFQRSGSWP